ncbi:beta-ketoacyl synthase N-terminal-like domain-containing protein [Lentzea sp. NPDC034063]|uniref:beta-ketoacyl synthase N-terminal-like domain-containing protein n=1 Tax=unclassified Lentzea TaxID=2643253 RepID=UPI0033CF9F06
MVGQGREFEPIAVVGMGLAVIGASDPDQYWQILCEGPELFTEATPDRWRTRAFTPGRNDVPDKGYQPLNGLITDFRPHPSLAAEGTAATERMDFNTLWLRHSIYQALDGVSRSEADRFVFCVGLTADGSQHLGEHQQIASVVQALKGSAGAHLTPARRREAAAAMRSRFTRGDAPAHAFLPQNIACAAIKGILPDGTPAHVVDTACSSSLYALDRAIRELTSGRTDIALCGGSLAQRVTSAVLFAQLGGLTRIGQIRAMDEGADGTLFADGAGVLVLKRLARAEADGDLIHGVISGIGLSADGRGKAINAASSRGQVLAARRALTKAELGPQDISLVIAHGTGTPAGDHAELTSIADVYRDRTGDPIPVVSNKSVIGHTGWAAGVMSVIHALLCLRHGKVPRQHRFVRMSSRIRDQVPMLTVPTDAVQWPRGGRPRRAMAMGFGFGGTNAAVVVSDHSGRSRSRAVRPADVDERVIVGWSTVRPPSGNGFGDHYPLPPAGAITMPRAVLRNIDRSQVMAIECFDRLPRELKDFCEFRKEAVGVFAASFGPTRNFQLGQLRVRMDDVEDTLISALGDASDVRGFLSAYRREIDEVMPKVCLDTSPGGMPNIIASRVSNYFDLQGLNLLVDGGEASLLKAFETADRYLETSDLDVAVVLGMSANTSDSWTSAVMPPGEKARRASAEGAFMFVVARKTTAQQAGLPVHATLNHLVREVAS